jgi:hypothetical protein
MLIFMDVTPGYYLEPGMEYWLVMAAYTVLGVRGAVISRFPG